MADIETSAASAPAPEPSKPEAPKIDRTDPTMPRREPFRPPAVTTEAEKAEDAYLATMRGGQSEGGDKDEQEAEPEAKPAKEPADSAESNEDFKRAMRALQRDDVPAETLEAMAGQNPQELLAWGLKRAEAQAHVDGLGNRIKALEAGQGKDTGKPDSEKAEPGAVDTKVATEALTKALEPFAQQFDINPETLAAPVSQYVDQRLSAATAAIEAPMRKMGEALAFIGNLVQDHLVSFHRNELSKTFPGLGEESKFEKVKEEMKALGQTGRYKSIPDLMRAASLVALGEEMVKEASVVGNRHAAARHAGKPTTETKPTSGRTRKAGSYDDRYLEARRKGMTPEEAKRHASSDTD